MNIFDYDICIGVDVGLSGGIAVFDTVSKELLSLQDMPTFEKENSSGIRDVIDVEKLKYLLEIPKLHEDSALVVFENIHAFGNSGFGIGTLMEQKGILRGMISVLGYTELQVAPKTWQKHFEIVPPKGLKGSSTKNTKAIRRKWLKNKSMEVARGKCDWEVLKTKTCDGLSDAVLIGLWALETFS